MHHLPKEDGNGVNQVDDIPRPEIKEPDRRESQNGQDNPTNPHKKAEGKKKNCKTHNKGQGGMRMGIPLLKLEAEMTGGK